MKPRARSRAVAQDADAAAGLAGEHRADLHLVDAGGVDAADLLLVDLLVGPDQHFPRVRVDDVLERGASQDAVAQLLDDLAALDQRGHLDALDGAAVVVGDDGVLRHVDETPRQVTRVRRLERGVGQALAGAVRRDEVLEDAQALAEVGGDGRLDDLARGLGHQAAHAGQLPDLLRRAAGARVGHDEDRVEALLLLPVSGLRVLGLLGGDAGHHLQRDRLGHLGPDVDHLVVALAVGDQALGVLLLDLGDLLHRLVEEHLLLVRDPHVVDADGDAGAGGVRVPHGPQLVGQEHGHLLAARPVAGVDQVGELLLAEHAVHQPEGQALGQLGEEQHAPDGGVDDARLAVFLEADLDLGLQVDLAVVVRHAHLVDGRVDAAGVRVLLVGLAELALRVRSLARHVVEAEDDVLRRDDDGLAVGGAEDVVGGHHQHARLHLRLDGQRHVDRHLVAVEVGVEGRAHQRVQLDRLALDEHGLEGLDAQAVQRGGAVEQHRVLADDLLEDVPDLGALLLHQLLGALDGGDVARAPPACCR